MGSRIRVDVIGSGAVAQIIHLAMLAQLSDRFDVTALCDVSATVLDIQTCVTSARSFGAVRD